SGVSLSAVHARDARGFRRAVRVPAQPAGGAAAEPTPCVALPVRSADRAGGLALDVLPSSDIRRRRLALARVEPWRLPGRRPRALRRLPRRAQRAGRCARPGALRWRADARAGLVRAVAARRPP